MSAINSISIEKIIELIWVFRGKKVILDADLASLYNVTTKRLNEAVKRNIKRFPLDFMFQLDDQKHEKLRSQIATSTPQASRGGRRYPPYVFTEQGVAMLSGILNSDRAINVNISIMRIFVQMRHLLLSNKELSIQLSELEKKYDSQFNLVFDAIRKIMLDENNKHNRPIGFIWSEDTE